MAEVIQFSQFSQIPTESRWFTVWKIAPGITAIYEPYHFQEVISYLIEGEEKALLLDSGMGIGNMRALVESLTAKEITLVCSHSHFDHVGGAWQFGECFLFDDPLAMKRLREGFILPEDDENLCEEALSLAGEPWFDLKKYSIKPCKAKPMHGGEVFDLGGRILKVLHTPGHSKDSIMLADDENKILFTGDTVYPAPLYAYFPGESSLRTYQQTIDRLSAKYSAYTLICSHNNPVMKGQALKEISEAFDKVLSGNAQWSEYFGHKNYLFEGFSIVV